jgi:hypothetical protein
MLLPLPVCVLQSVCRVLEGLVVGSVPMAPSPPEEWEPAALPVHLVLPLVAQDLHNAQVCCRLLPSQGPVSITVICTSPQSLVVSTLARIIETASKTLWLPGDGRLVEPGQPGTVVCSAS